MQKNTLIKHVVDGTIPVGTVLPQITGEISKVSKRSTGTSQHGEWSFQRAEFTCISGQKISLVFKDRDEFPNHLTNRQVVLTSNETKHGLRGVTVEMDSYKGQDRLQLKVTKIADIETLSPADDSEDDQLPGVENMPEQSWGDDEDALEAAAAKRASDLVEDAKHTLGAKEAPTTSASVKIDPSGFTMTSVTYRETRPLAQYQAISVEIECTINPGGTVANAFEALKVTAQKCLDKREKEWRASGN